MSGLSSPEVDRLLTRLDELVRWRPGSTGAYHDAHGALPRIRGAANHVVMGRRGSGKTRLLDELRRSVGADTYVVAFGAEDYKELTYPDILIQILRTFLRDFESALRPEKPILSTDWWKDRWSALRHFLRYRLRERKRAALIDGVHRLEERLRDLLSESDELEAEYRAASTASSRSATSDRASVDTGHGSLAVGSDRENSTSLEEERSVRQRELKRNKVERLLGDFKRLLEDVCESLGVRLILAVDDFYFIRRADQPPVIDYIHRICKDTNAFLKVATIRHRTQLSDKTEVTRGVVSGHEIQPIDLELSLGHLESISQFLERIWMEVCEESGVSDPQDLFMGEGLTQAVLASGGVPRDFFGVVKTAITIARERQEDRVGKLRIAEAARQYTDETKLPEIQLDAAVDRELRDLLLIDIVRFARDTKKKNCFHIDLDELEANQDVAWLLDSLVDSRLLHLISDNTTNSRRAGRFAAYLLDVGLYAHPQRRGPNAVEEIEFWTRDNAGRLKNLESCPVYTLRALDELKDGAGKLALDEAEVRNAVLPPDEDTDKEPGSFGSQIEIDFPSRDIDLN